MSFVSFVFFRLHVALLAAALVAAASGSPLRATPHVRHIEYSDLPAAMQKRFAADGVPESRFAEYLRTVDADTARRLEEGEREHFIYYALQSTRFTDRPRIEPAIAARRFVEGLAPADRARLLENRDYAPPRGWPALERARVQDALAALAAPAALAAVTANDKNTSDVRLSYFKQLLAPRGELPPVEALYADYVRVARFLYKKEFESGGGAAEVAELYRSRPHSSDTQIEAGFGVYLGLGAMHALDPERQISRVLIVGPGLDFAPRTDLIDVVAPQMYQPFAVADALLSLSIGSEERLDIESVDVNPRVVQIANSAAREPLTLHLFTGINETRDQPLSSDYKDYLRTLGRAIGRPVPAPPAVAAEKRYHHSIAVRETVSRAMTAERLNIATQRFVDRPRFDLIVMTNVLTYFDDRQLALTLANIATMLAPGGYLLHNESRAGLVETAAQLQLPAVHMRTAVLGGSTSHPLYDAVWLHQKARR